MGIYGKTIEFIFRDCEGESMKKFKAIETDGREISLEDFKGRNVVLYFYPKDNTSGCTTEALEFNDLLEEFKKENTEVLGISKDSLKSHAKFREKHDLKFLLLSDESQETMKDFDVLKPKKMYGREYIGVERSTFLFNDKGELVKEWRKVKAKGHAQEVLDYIRENK